MSGKPTCWTARPRSTTPTPARTGPGAPVLRGLPEGARPRRGGPAVPAGPVRLAPVAGPVHRSDRDQDPGRLGRGVRGRGRLRDPGAVVRRGRRPPATGRPGPPHPRRRGRPAPARPQVPPSPGGRAGRATPAGGRSGGHPG